MNKIGLRIVASVAYAVTIKGASESSIFSKGGPPRIKQAFDSILDGTLLADSTEPSAS